MANTVEIKCVDCNASRHIPKACLKIVSRCEDCQKKYRKTKIKEFKQAKKDKKVIDTIVAAPARTKIVINVSQPQAVEVPVIPPKILTPEERTSALERLMKLHEGVDSTLDW